MDVNNQALAEMIANQVLTYYDGKKDIECTRIALKLGPWPDGEKDMGGKAKSCLVGEIKEILDRELDGF